MFKVIKFAVKHKNPIQRSAFTYCEDELPSRLDLGKEKYGGPFKTEEVENVKVFLGILRVLLTLGPIFAVTIAADGFVTGLAWHMDSNYSPTYKKDLFGGGRLTKLLVVVLLPLYLCLLRPFLGNYIPGILKRIGLGMILILLSSLCTLLTDVIGHRVTGDKECFLFIFDFNNITDSNVYVLPSTLDISADVLILQCSLNAVGYILLYIAVYEFICAQSPHAMKGLLIGTFFAIKGVFQLLAILVLFAPFTTWNLSRSFPSCGFVYYLVNIVVGLTGMVAYVCVARTYRYRQRDEPDNTYRYVEEYYAKALEESSNCLLYTSPSPRDATLSRMPSSA